MADKLHQKKKKRITKLLIITKQLCDGRQIAITEKSASYLTEKKTDK